MTNVEALKNLYLALGGSAEDLKGIDSNAAIINLLAGVAGGGGSTGGLVVGATISEDGIMTLDKTFAQISDAFGAGKNVVVRWTVPNINTFARYGVVAVEETESTSLFQIKCIDGVVFNAQSRDAYPIA